MANLQERAHRFLLAKTFEHMASKETDPALKAQRLEEARKLRALAMNQTPTGRSVATRL